jgi:integrase
MTFAALVAAFLADVAATRKPATAAQYQRRLAAAVRVLGSRDLADLAAADLQQHLDRESRFADGSEKAPDTIRANMIALDQVQAWGVERRHLAAVILPRQRKPGGRQRDYLPSLDEVKAILAHARPDFALMYRALRCSGARPGELCRATISDYSRRDEVITLKDHKTSRKTGKPRLIDVGQAMAKLVDQAIAGRASGPIFLRANGRPWTVPALGHVFRGIRKRAGLPKQLVLYLTRHEFATELVEKFGIAAAAACLGHANISTTTRYSKPRGAKRREWQEGFDEGLDPPKAA